MTLSSTTTVSRVALALALVVSCVLVAGCGGPAPRDVYDRFRAAYFSGNYAEMAKLLSKQSSERLSKDRGGVEKALMEDLPPIDKVKQAAIPLVQARLGDPNWKPPTEPDKLEDYQKQRDRLQQALNTSNVFVLTEAARSLARAGLVKPDLAKEFTKLNTKWVLVFTIPDKDIGSAIDFVAQPPSGYMMTVKIAGESLTLPLQNDDGNWKIAWQGK